MSEATSGPKKEPGAPDPVRFRATLDAPGAAAGDSPSSFASRNYLLLVVFVTGACVLAIEVAAVRILAAYFGSTIYTVSSVLSVILAALSLGYYLGGRWADLRPSASFFYLIITASAFAVLVMQMLIEWALPDWGRSMDLVWGPLQSSLILFLLPSFLLGLLSPYAVKLQHGRIPGQGVATTAGKVFFWSTAGSIAGSLVTGFYLIPSFGLRSITLGIAAVLLVIGLTGLALVSRGPGRRWGTPLLLVLGLLLGAGALSQPAGTLYLYDEDGRYERIRIYDTQYDGRPARLLQQDLSSDSAIFLESDELPFRYARYYQLLLALRPDAGRAAVIGGGAYTIPKKLAEDKSDLLVDVAEVEPRLFDLAQQYFGVPDTPRIRNYVMDGRRFLYERPDTYDIIFSDAFHSYLAIPMHMTTVEFFETVKRSLREGGVFMANVIGSLEDRAPSVALSEMRTLLSVFPNSYFIAVGSAESISGQNLIYIALNSSEPVDFSSLETPDSTIADSARGNLLDPERFDLESHTLFTDDYAPVERYIAELINR